MLALRLGSTVRRWGTETENIDGILGNKNTLRKTKGDNRTYQSWQQDTLRDDCPLERLPPVQVSAVVMIERMQSFIMQVCC